MPPETTLEEQYFEEHRPEGYVDPENDIPSFEDLKRARNLAKTLALGAYITFLRKSIIKGLQTVAWASVNFSISIQLDGKRLALPLDLLAGEPEHIKYYTQRCLHLSRESSQHTWIKDVDPQQIPLTFQPFLDALKEEFEEKGWIIEQFEERLKVSPRDQ